jgi:high-affinity K+ transport system ATPase subunit B
MKVNEVKYINDYTIFVSFDDGISGIIQLNDLVEHGIFQQLKNIDKFSKVYTTGFSIAWSEELEIDAASIYAELTGIIPSNYFNNYTNYASN